MIRSNLKGAVFGGRQKKRMTNIVLWAWVLLFAAATIASAHRVIVFAWIEGDTVFTESKFPGGANVSNGKITVLDEAGQELLTGKTDEQGAYSFSLTSLKKPSELKIVLNAGMGHQAYWTLTRQDVGQALGAESAAGASAVEAETNLNPPSGGPSPSSLPPPEDNTPCRLNDAELRQIVEAAVDRKLSPVMDMLVAIREEAAIGLDDVVAGLGYIFGLTGVLAWFYSRKKG